MKKQKYRALLDSGAEVSLIGRRVYDSFKIKPKLFKHGLNLSTAANTPMHVDGFSELTFTLGGSKMSHKFYVVQNLNRNVIIGLEWLKSRGVRVYHDLSCICVHDTYIPLIDDMHVASIARTRHKVEISPQSTHICQVTVRKHPGFSYEREYEVSPIETNTLVNEPGLLIPNSICKLAQNRKIPVMVVNTTNKFISLKKGLPLVSIKPFNSSEISSIQKEKILSDNKQSPNLDLEHFGNIDVPPELKHKILPILQKNSDSFASSDAQMGHSKTIKMKTDTGDHPPIKLRPYRVQLNNRNVIEHAVKEMLDAKIIERSR